MVQRAMGFSRHEAERRTARAVVGCLGFRVRLLFHVVGMEGELRDCRRYVCGSINRSMRMCSVVRGGVNCSYESHSFEYAVQCDVVEYVLIATLMKL